MRRCATLSIALAAGAGLALLAFVVMTRPHPGDGVASYFLERAYTEGGGTNVVNVILVDFRGFDTLGEITVLCIVALHVFALLRRFRPAPESIALPRTATRAGRVGQRAPGPAVLARPSASYLLVPAVIMRARSSR